MSDTPPSLGAPTTDDVLAGLAAEVGMSPEDLIAWGAESGLTPDDLAGWQPAQILDDMARSQEGGGDGPSARFQVRQRAEIPHNAVFSSQQIFGGDVTSEEALDLLYQMTPRQIQSLQTTLYRAGYYGATEDGQDRRAVNAQPDWGNPDDLLAPIQFLMSDSFRQGREDRIDEVLGEKLEIEAPKMEQWYTDSGVFVGEPTVVLPTVDELAAQLRERATHGGQDEIGLGRALTDEEANRLANTFAQRYAEEQLRRTRVGQRALPGEQTTYRTGTQDVNRAVASAVARQFGGVVYAGQRPAEQIPNQMTYSSQILSSTVDGDDMRPVVSTIGLEDQITGLAVALSQRGITDAQVQMAEDGLSRLTVSVDPGFEIEAGDIPFTIADSKDLAGYLGQVAIETGNTKIGRINERGNHRQPEWVEPVPEDGVPVNAKQRRMIEDGFAYEIAGSRQQLEQLNQWAQNEGASMIAGVQFLADNDGDGFSDRVRIYLNDNARVPEDLAIQTGNDTEADQFLNGVRMMESGGSYKANAYGWTPEQWRNMATRAGADPSDTSAANQDLVASAVAKGLFERYGDWELVATAWRSGTSFADRARDDRRLVRRSTEEDGNTVGSYVDNVLGYMAGNSSFTTDSGTAGSDGYVFDPVTGLSVPAGVRVMPQEIDLEELAGDVIRDEFEDEYRQRILSVMGDSAEDKLEDRASRVRRFSR